MIRSMTAFASSEAEINNLTLNCDLRAVNHRYCDIFIKLPEWLRSAEADIRAAIVSKLKRGKIECSLSCKNQHGQVRAFNVNMKAVQTILAATAEIEQQMQGALAFSALDVLAFPGVQQEPEINQELLMPGINKLISDTVKLVLEAREREGRQLELIVENRCLQMQEFVKAARVKMPEVLQNLRTKLTIRLTEITAQPDFDRLEQEMVFLVQKLDVDEELDRLDTHISEVLRVIQLDEPVGRKLDFLMQEMNREANTLGSKSADKEMTRISIELKVLIEKMREQIQNIE
jgi:uncharacterized protein (TIGR00255 family)